MAKHETDVWLYCCISKCLICLVAGGFVLSLCGEDKDHWELLHGRLWLGSRQTGGRSSWHSALCFFFYYYIFPPIITIYVSLRLPQASMEWNHMSELVLFALAMQETLREINRHSAKNFQLRVGKWFSGWPHTLTQTDTYWCRYLNCSLTQCISDPLTIATKCLTPQ